MITLQLLTTVFWYIGGLILFWRITLAYRGGVSFVRTAPSVAIIILMLVNASFVYYDYLNTPANTLVHYLWFIAVAWVLAYAVKVAYRANV